MEVTKPAELASNKFSDQPSLPPLSGTTITDLISAVEQFMEVRCSNCGGKLEVPADCPSPEQVVCGQCAWQEGR